MPSEAATCAFEKIAEMGTKIMKETAKTMGLSEAATAKLEEYFKKCYDEIKAKGECPKEKTEEEKKKFLEEATTAVQAEVDEAEKELVAKVINAAYEELQKKKAECAAKRAEAEKTSAATE